MSEDVKYSIEMNEGYSYAESKSDVGDEMSEDVKYSVEMNNGEYSYGESKSDIAGDEMSEDVKYSVEMNNSEYSYTDSKSDIAGDEMSEDVKYSVEMNNGKYSYTDSKSDIDDESVSEDVKYSIKMNNGGYSYADSKSDIDDESMSEDVKYSIKMNNDYSYADSKSDSGDEMSEDVKYSIGIKREYSNAESTMNISDQEQETKPCIENITIKRKYEEDEPIVEYELVEDLNDDDDLPAGWKKCSHDSGMPVYLNEEMKVCSFTKPYFLGTNSLKNHPIPVANIPCLNYKLKLLHTNENKDDDSKKCPVTLSHEEYREYCSKIFKFKNIKFMRFSSWDKRREYIRMVKADRRRKDLPKLKDKSQLISFQVQQAAVKSVPQNIEEEWTINLNGKSYVSILHEYIQRVLKTQPSYEFKELENARYPYLATVILDGMQYGVGIGSSKKQAKLDAARATLEILLPSVKNQIQVNRRHVTNDHRVTSSFDGDSIFDKLLIKDSRIPEFCSQAAESMPYDMLQTCVKRNFGEDVNIQIDIQSMQSATDSEIFYRCTVSVDKHSATVICKNKRDGRQKGAQALLKVLHPHINYFGSLLRLYSHQNFGCSEKKLDEPGTLSPKPRKCANSSILRRLKTKMSLVDEPSEENKDNKNVQNSHRY